MFIEQYKLENNPFATDVARPMLDSHSMHYAAFKLQEVVNRQVQTLFLSGAAGVGKTAFVRQRLRAVRDSSISWIKPAIETKEQLLARLFDDVGPGSVEGTPAELSKILHVYLRHQAANGRFSFLVVDALERASPLVLREIEALAQLRLRNRPLLHLVLLTRNEDMVSNLLPQYHGGPMARAVHQRLTGFTPDETRVYVHACLRGAGCEWAEELIPEDVIVDIQAFTQGVVGDINAICRLALDSAAELTPAGNRQPRVTRALLKEAGARLNLRYESTAWAPSCEEPLSPDAVQISDPTALKLEAARLIVTSGRKQVAEISLNRPRMVLGRDTSCDISLDSVYVSRYQNLFMETPEGWMLIDLSSTNGCFVNGRRVREHRLRDGDLIAVGHHHIRFSGPERAGAPNEDASRTVKTIVDVAQLRPAAVGDQT